MLHTIDWHKVNGLLPVVVQDVHSHHVLMLGYMNEEALTKTISEKVITFYSRTRQQLWTKGETSGNHLKVENFHLDCDHDTLLILASPLGPTCHKGSLNCFEYNLNSEIQFLQALYNLIAHRKANPIEGSYTTSLFNKGPIKIAQKVGEEAVEVVLAPQKSAAKGEIVNETADLFYHLMAFLNVHEVTLAEVILELKKRHDKKA